MPRYLVERTFPDGLAIPITETGSATSRMVISRNAELAMTWLRSYLSGDRTRSSPAAICRTATHNRLPVDRITPYFYCPEVS